MNAWRNTGDLDPGQTDYSGLSAEPISKVVSLTASGAMQLIAGLRVSSGTLTSVTLQHSVDGTNWQTAKVITASTTGEEFVTFNGYDTDASSAPLLPLVRIIASGTGTVDRVFLIQGQ